MPFGREVGLSPSDIVLDGAQLSSPKGAETQIFGRYLLWPNGMFVGWAEVHGERG